MTLLEFKWWAAALLGGAGCGLAGFFLVAMDLPFMGVCLAHAGLAGAVLAHACGWPPLGTALAASLAVAALVGPLAERTRTHAGTVLSVFFSLTLGLAFLGIGLLRDRRTELLGLMWGNLLLVRWADLWALALAWLLPLALLARFAKEAKAVLFDREIARACGLPAALIANAVIASCGLTVTVNLHTVGGLMLYCLLTNPAVAALQIATRFRAAVALSMTLGAGCAAGGLGVSLALNWPTGASIVLVSALVYAAAIGARVCGLRAGAVALERRW